MQYLSNLCLWNLSSINNYCHIKSSGLYNIVTRIEVIEISFLTLRHKVNLVIFRTPGDNNQVLILQELITNIDMSRFTCNTKKS